MSVRSDVERLLADIHIEDGTVYQYQKVEDLLVSYIDSQLAESQARLSKAMALINEQAEDDGLWFRATTASEAYLQQSLRLLTDAIEGVSDGADL